MSAATATIEANAAVRQGRDILELPVYTIAEGKSVGSVDTLFVRRENLTVPWVRLKTGALASHAFTPYSAFQTVGADIALLPNAGLLQSALPADEKNALDTGLTGRPVLTPGGEQVGTIAGFEIDTADGAILAFRVRAVAGFFRHVLAAVRDDTVLVAAGRAG